MKKKLLFLVCTLGAFLFLFGITTTYAAELPEETTEEVVESTDAEETTTEKSADEEKALLDVELSEEELQKIAYIISASTNENVGNMAIALYSSIGITGIICLIIVILLVVFAKNKAATSSFVNKVVEGLNEEQKKFLDDFIKDTKANTEELKNLLTDLLVKMRNEKKTEIESGLEELNSLIEESVAKKVE